MALDSNFGSSIPDVDSEPSISSQSNSKGKQTRSNIWQYCRVLNENENRDEQGRLIYACNACNYRTIATSNFRLHYKKTHDTAIEISEGKTRRTKQAEEELQNIITRIQGTELSDKILEETLDKQAIETALIELIIVRNLSFRIVESQEFQTFIYSLNRQALKILPSSHPTIATKVFSINSLELSLYDT
jgi:hypothetical protein